MKSLNKNYTATLLFVLFTSLACLFTSCENEDFFELKAPPTTEWRTINDMEHGIVSVYDNYINRRENCVWALQTFIHFAMSDIVREISINGGWSSNLLIDRSTDQYFNQVQKTYGLSYRTILLANNLLEFIASDPFPNATAADKTLNIDRIKGEALFLRALSYYQLVTYYAPAYEPGGANNSKLLSLRLNVSQNIETALDNSVVETKMIYDQIIQDLTDAISLLPLKYESGMHPSYQFGRATKHAARAALAQVNCLMGNYDAALSELNQILDDPEMPRTLEDHPEKVWLNNDDLTPWNSPEVIWYAYFSDIEASEQRHVHEIRFWGYFINSLYHNRKQQYNWWIWGLNRGTLLKCDMIAEDNSTPDSWKYDKRNILYNRFEGYDSSINQKDGNKNFRLDYLYGTAFAPFVEYDDPVFICSKYYRVPTKETVLAQGEASPQNIPLIRAAELHLWRAAIKQITGKGNLADDINVIRQRSWDADLGGDYVPLTDAEITWDVIDAEWIKEMAFEGDRIIWLQMFKKPVGPGDRSVASINPPYDGLYWKIPLKETDFYPTTGE